MPDFGIAKGLEKGLLKGTKKGAKEAVVKRPGQIAVEEAAKKEMAPKIPVEPTVQAEVPPVKATPEITPAEKVMTPKEQIVENLDVAAEAERLSKVELKDYALDETFQTNFDTINTTDGIKATIADVAQQNAGKIDEARRGVITNQQLQGLADDLDLNTDVIKQVIERENGGILNAETILAARQVLNSSAERIHTLATNITKGTATDLDRLKFRRQLQWHREYQTQFMGARAEAGRALNAFNIPTEANVDWSRIREMVDAADGHSTDRVASAIALMDNTAAISKASRKYTQSKLMGTLNELFINSILSGPKTHLTNTAGNIMMQAMGIAETAVAARIGRFLGAEERMLVGEASALAHGTISAWKDGFRMFAKTMKTGIALDDVVKFEGTRRRSISAEHLLSPEQRATPLGRFAEALLDGPNWRIPIGKKGIPIPGIGQIVRAPTERLMLPTDEMFKTLAYRGEIERQAFLHVYDQVATGVATKKEAARIAREFMEDPTKEAIKAAEDYTRYVTFQNQLGEVGQKAQLFLRSAPVLSLLAPFIRTPVNIFTAGILDRSPVALIRPKFWAAMKAGGRERDMMLARMTMGSATAAVVASYAMDGTITGAGPSNPDARALLELSDWQPYSIKVGDKYHSYARMEPLAFVIGATADAVEILSYINSDVDGLDDELQQTNNAVSAIIIGIANNTMSKTYVKGIADFTEMLSDPQRYFAGWSRNFATAFVPFSALRSQLGQIDDPYMREAWTTLDAIRNKSGILGLSEESPPRRDVFGEPRRVYAGSLLGPMSPIPDREISNDPVVDELVTLMEQTRDVPVTMPSKRIEGMRLDMEEYDALIRIARTRAAPNGMTFKEALRDLFNQPGYALATPDMRVELVKNIQHKYDAIARLTLEAEDPRFAARLNTYRQKRNELRFGAQ